MWYLDEPTLDTGVCTHAYINTTYNTSDAAGVEYWASGKFGENSGGPAYGVLIHVRSESYDNPTACTPPLITHCTPDRKLPVSEPWIALIKRGDCEFGVKMTNAINSNASAVIVYDDRETTNLDTMKIPFECRGISAVLTYKKTGEKWASLVDKDVRVMANITVGNPCSTDVNFNRTSVLFLSISFIVLMVVALAWLSFYYVQRFRYVHNKDRLSKRLCSAAKKALSKIPTRNVKSEDKEIQGDGECCAVCIEPYRLSDVLRILPCKHEFHRMCVDPWLLEHRTCPMCKMDILKHYGFVFAGSQESILHMEVEDAEAAAVNNDTDRLQQRSRNSVSQIRPREHETLGPVSPESESNSCQSSSPDDVSPTLHSDQCYTGFTSHPGESSSLMDTSTQYSTANAGAHHKSEKCSNCMIRISVHESTGGGSNKCDTSNMCHCEFRQTPTCDTGDCELESYESRST
jgi:hypothetical protein